MFFLLVTSRAVGAPENQPGGNGCHDRLPATSLRRCAREATEYEQISKTESDVEPVYAGVELMKIVD